VSAPATQLAAYEHIKRSGVLARAQFQVYEYLTFHPGATRNEVDRDLGCGRPNANASRRLVELERRGLLRRGDPRLCSVTGHACETWWTTTATDPLPLPKARPRLPLLESTLATIRSLVSSSSAEVCPDGTVAAIRKVVADVPERAV